MLEHHLRRTTNCSQYSSNIGCYEHPDEPKKPDVKGHRLQNSIYMQSKRNEVVWTAYVTFDGSGLVVSIDGECGKWRYWTYSLPLCSFVNCRLNWPPAWETLPKACWRYYSRSESRTKALDKYRETMEWKSIMAANTFNFSCHWRLG